LQPAEPPSFPPAENAAVTRVPGMTPVIDPFTFRQEMRSQAVPSREVFPVPGPPGSSPRGERQPGERTSATARRAAGMRRYPVLRLMESREILDTVP